jgi:serine/threonine-protein kinase
MELLKGLDLQHHVEQYGPLEFSRAIEYLRQVASGLDKAHGWKDCDGRAAPIVHRDLKPENLFLTHREDGSPLVKILDFGLAKVLSVSATLSSEVKGTPLYMAPEQFSQVPVTPATDIWALGLIAFFLLTGKPYWLCARDDRAVLPAVIKEVAEGVTQPATARMRDLGADVTVPESFDEWFAQCVNLDPTRRFAQASGAVRALSAALDMPLNSAPLASSGALLQPGTRPSFSELTPAAAITAERAAAGAPPGGQRSPRVAAFRYVFAALALLVAVGLLFALRKPAPLAPEAAPGSVVRHATEAPSAPSEQAAHSADPTAATFAGAGSERASAGSAVSVPDRHKETPPHAPVSAPGAHVTQPPVGVHASSSSNTAASSSGSRSAREGAVLSLTTSDKARPAPPVSSHGAGSTPAPASSHAPRDPADHR